MRPCVSVTAISFLLQMSEIVTVLGDGLTSSAAKELFQNEDIAEMSQKFAIIGYGAITDEIVLILEKRQQLDYLTAILVRPEKFAAAEAKSCGRVFITSSIDTLLAREPRSVLECAGHGAVRQYGSAVLSRGIDLIIASVGVLADKDFSKELLNLVQNPARILIPSGAIAGIDGLLAARTAGLSEVTYTSIKPPPAWIGTPAEDQVRKHDGNQDAIVLFTGTARDAARLFPKNVNVGAAVALAGLGLDRTCVKLISDPAAAAPLGIIDARGAFGTFRFEILAHASPTNPKTSALTAHSMLAAAVDGVCFSAAAALVDSVTP